MSKVAKRNLTMGIVTSILAIFFTFVYYFNILKKMDLLLSVTYVAYFVGIALFFNGGYCKENNHKVSAIVNNLLGLAFVIFSIALLIYGFTTGTIQMFH